MAGENGPDAPGGPGAPEEDDEVARMMAAAMAEEAGQGGEGAPEGDEAFNAAMATAMDESTPDMPVQNEVRTTKHRDWEAAFNDVDVELSVVLGRATMPINQLLKMGRGAVIELDATVDDDVMVYGNSRLIARGQVMISGENIAVTITETVPITET